MEEMKENVKEEAASMSDAQKGRLYERALGYLTSSLTNDELYEESLNMLLSLGDYKDSAELYVKYNAQYAKKREETMSLSKKRKVSRAFQGVMVGIGFGIVVLLILILVYALKLDVVR